MPEKTDRETLLRKIRTLEKEVAWYRTSLGRLEIGEKWFSQIVQGTPIAAFVIDGNHRIINCNSAYEKLTGIPVEKMIGTDDQWRAFYESKRPTLADLIVDGAVEPDIAGHYSGKSRKSRTTEGAYEVEDFFPALGSRGKWLFFTAAPLKDRDGNIQGAIETLQDITKQKRAVESLVESERRLRTLFAFVPYPIVVYTREGHVYYVNPSFTDVFGWTLEELEGGGIPYEPEGLAGQTAETIASLFTGNSHQRFETKRLTRDGRVLDVVVRAAAYSDARGKDTGVLMIIRDVTPEKREARNTEAIHRISLALPAYTELDPLLEFIGGEVRRLLGSEGAIIPLLDVEKDEIFILGASYENQQIQERVKNARFPVDRLVAGRVIKTGRPVIINDEAETGGLNRERDERLGYRTRNLILVPLKTSDRTIGVLGAVNKKEGAFDDRDYQLLSTIGSTAALSIENVRYSGELKDAYREVQSLNRAKDKVIHHLSHELKTPVAVLGGSLTILEKRLAALPEKAWGNTLGRARRNLGRLVEIQMEVGDIIEGRQFDTRNLISTMLEECADELETLLAEEVGEETVGHRVRKRIDEIFGPRDLCAVRIDLAKFVEARVMGLRGDFVHRKIDVHTECNPGAVIAIPMEVIEKVVDGLIKNAVENTPDKGKIEIRVHEKGKGTVLVVSDFGIGITEDAKKRIFEGFFPTLDTLSYSSKMPFDFNAGGKGADLLRMKIFSSRYGFDIHMDTSRCPYIPNEGDKCPGNIEKCEHCSGKPDCYKSGGTTFTLYFPPVSEER